MSNQAHNKPTDSVGTPPSSAVGAPFEMSHTTGETRILAAALRSVEDRLNSASSKFDRIPEIVSDVRHLQSDLNALKADAKSDFRWLITIFGAGFLLLAGFIIYGYFRLDDRLSKVESIGTRIDTKLEDLLLRIPPVVTPPSAQPKK